MTHPHPNPDGPQISGHADPDGEAPWVMQLVARIEKTDPPTRTAVCEAAAVAVLALLTDSRALPAGEWAPPVRRWTDGRIRKHCRRARGAAWERVQALPGVTVDVGAAQVRAFVPCPVDQVHRYVAKLQMSGPELADPAARTVAEPGREGAVILSICPAPFLPLGKAAAAAGHAAQLAAAQMPRRRRERWAAAGFPVRVEHPDPDRWAALRAVAPVQVLDAGLTTVAPGTCTALARWDDQHHP